MTATNPTTPAKSITIKVLNNCARCGGNHTGLEAKPLKNPGDTGHTHFAWCQVEQAPILVNMTQDTKGENPGEYEFVEHPKHYNSHPAGIECKDVIQWFCANIAFAIKHLWRCGLKPGADHIQDLEKARVYIGFEIDRLKGMQEQEDQAK